MVPVSHLIVSYIRDSGELVADSIDIEVDGLMQNFVSLRCFKFLLLTVSVLKLKENELIELKEGWEYIVAFL